MKLGLSMLVLLGLASTACSNFKTNAPVVAKTESEVQSEADRSIAQSREGVSLSRIKEGQTIKLARCGGTAKLTRVQGVLTLQVRNATCSNLKTTKGSWKLNGTAQGERWANVTFDDSVPGDRMVLVGSNAYIESRGAEGNGDYMTVKIEPKMVTLNLTQQAQTKEINLEHCNGSIQASIANGRVTINVSNSGCSKFDILSNSGDHVKYEMKTIPEVSADAGFSGNYTIPNKFYDRGMNGIVIRLVAPRLVEEKILVKFAAW